MKRSVIFLIAKSLFVIVLSSCSVQQPEPEPESERIIEFVYDEEAVALDDPLTQNQELFLEDLDYMLYVLENNFALFDVAYWARGVDITAIFAKKT